MSIHNEDIRRCDIPRVLPNAKSVPWDADGMMQKNYSACLVFPYSAFIIVSGISRTIHAES